MDAKQFLNFLHRIEPLKTNTRHSYTAGGAHETVAAHTWRVATMALLLEPYCPGLDFDKIIRMCLVHDFGEAVTGDIPSFQKSGADEAAEQQAIARLVATAPPQSAQALRALFAEMDEMATPEAKFYKALDKFEAVIQHNEADISTWLPLEYELQQVYGADSAQPFPLLVQIRQQMLQDTQEKIAAVRPPCGRQ